MHKRQYIIKFHRRMHGFNSHYTPFFHPKTTSLHITGRFMLTVQQSKPIGVQAWQSLLPRSKLFYALKYTFTISNTESEYEAVLTRLQVVRTLHIQKLHIFTDSQVIADHINGEFEAKEDNMQRYLQLVSLFLKNFQFLKIEHITRK